MEKKKNNNRDPQHDQMLTNLAIDLTTSYVLSSDSLVYR